MARVVLTGCSGKLGRAVTRELLSHGRTGANLDRAPPPLPVPEDMRRFAQIDFTDYGQIVKAFTSMDGRYAGVDARVHLATIPGIPFKTPPPYLPVNEEYPAQAGDGLLPGQARGRADGRVPVTHQLGPHETLSSIERVLRVLRYQPKHSRRDERRDTAY